MRKIVLSVVAMAVMSTGAVASDSVFNNELNTTLKPTPDEVRAYIKANGYHTEDAEKGYKRVEVVNYDTGTYINYIDSEEKGKVLTLDRNYSDDKRVVLTDDGEKKSIGVTKGTNYIVKTEGMDATYVVEYNGETYEGLLKDLKPTIDPKEGEHLTHGDIMSEYVNQAIEIADYDATVSNEGVVTFKNGQVVDLKDEVQVAKAKAALKEITSKGLVNEKGHYLDAANKLIGSLSAQDKADYVSEFKLLETNEQKAAWFKKVIVAETSVENAIQFALKGSNSEVVSAYMLEKGLITQTKNGYKVNTDSEAYKDLKSIRSEKWAEHVGNYEPVVGIDPINPDLGIDPKEGEHLTHGDIMSVYVNQAIEIAGYDATVSNEGVVTFKNGQVVDLKNELQVAKAKAALKEISSIGIDPIDVVITPIDPGFGVDPINPDLGIDPKDGEHLTHGDIMSEYANKLIYTAGYNATVSNKGVVTFKNGQTVDLQDETEVTQAKAAIKKLAAGPETKVDNEMKAIAIDAVVPILSYDHGMFNTELYTGLKMVAVQGTVDGIDDRDGYAQAVVGVEESMDLGTDIVQLTVGLEAQLGYKVSGVSPSIGIKGNITENLSVDVKVEYLSVAFNEYKDRAVTPTIGLNYKF